MKQKRMILMAAMAACALLVQAGKIETHESVLTTSGTATNVSDTFYVEQGVLDSIYIDCGSATITGTVAVVRDSKVVTDAAQTLASVSSADNADTTVVPFEFYTTSSGTVQAGTNAPKAILLCRDTLTASVLQPATNAASKTWRVVTRWTVP